MNRGISCDAAVLRRIGGTELGRIEMQRRLEWHWLETCEAGRAQQEILELRAVAHRRKERPPARPDAHRKRKPRRQRVAQRRQARTTGGRNTACDAHTQHSKKRQKRKKHTITNRSPPGPATTSSSHQPANFHPIHVPRPCHAVPL
jgi:hypothetical protein